MCFCFNRPYVPVTFLRRSRRLEGHFALLSKRENNYGKRVDKMLKRCRWAFQRKRHRVTGSIFRCGVFWRKFCGVFQVEWISQNCSPTLPRSAYRMKFAMLFCQIRWEIKRKPPSSFSRQTCAKWQMGDVTRWNSFPLIFLDFPSLCVYLLFSSIFFSRALTKSCD